jgi:phosphoglycerate dehydrogenase-like enzyme
LALREEGFSQAPASATGALFPEFARGDPMRIGIIGAGNIGATLVRKLAAGGHEVKLANSKGPDTIRDVARE